MANVRGTRGPIGDGINTLRQRNAVVEEIVPSHDWTEDLNGHYLLVDLLDFKKEQVKIQVIDSGVIRISGERAINQNKRIRFEQTFKVPENTDINAIKAKFDGENRILYVTVPKPKKIEEKKSPEPEPQPDHVGLSGQKSGANGAIQEENVRENADGDGEKIRANDSRVGDQECKAKENERSQINAPVISQSEGNFKKSWDHDPSYYLKNAMEILAKNRRIVITAILAFSLGVLMTRKIKSNED